MKLDSNQKRLLSELKSDVASILEKIDVLEKSYNEANWQVVAFRKVKNNSYQILTSEKDKIIFKLNIGNTYNCDGGIGVWSFNDLMNNGISVRSGEIEIYSVKRLSDGEIFTIGDEYSLHGTALTGKIDWFRINGNGQMAVGDNVSFVRNVPLDNAVKLYVHDIPIGYDPGNCQGGLEIKRELKPETLGDNHRDDSCVGMTEAIVEKIKADTEDYTIMSLISTSGRWKHFRGDSFYNPCLIENCSLGELHRQHYKIESVKRKSDNKLFSLGDYIMRFPKENEIRVIYKFRIENDGKDVFAYCNVDGAIIKQSLNELKKFEII